MPRLWRWSEPYPRAARSADLFVFSGAPMFEKLDLLRSTTSEGAPA